MLLRRRQKATQKYDRFNRCRRWRLFEIGMGVVALDMEYHSAMAPLLGGVDIEVHTTGSIPMRQPLRILERRLDGVERRPLTLRGVCVCCTYGPVLAWAAFDGAPP